MTDLNRLMELGLDKPIVECTSREQRQRVMLRWSLARAIEHLDQMDLEMADWPRLQKQGAALLCLAEAGVAAGKIYDEMRPRVMALEPKMATYHEPMDVEAYEDRLEQEGYSS